MQNVKGRQRCVQGPAGNLVLVIKKTSELNYWFELAVEISESAFVRVKVGELHFEEHELVLINWFTAAINLN